MSIEHSSTVHALSQPSFVVREYEFDELESRVIHRLASRLRWFGYGLFGLIATQGVIALLSLRSNPLAPLSAIVTALILGTIAASLLAASRSLAKITETQGDDVSHLMTALGALSNAYGVQTVLTLIGLLLSVFSAALLAMQ